MASWIEPGWIETGWIESTPPPPTTEPVEISTGAGTPELININAGTP